MRVLHLSAGNLYGGIERMLVTLAGERHLCPEMEPHFGLCFEGRVAEELRAAGVPVQILGPARFSRPWTVWNARRQFRELLHREKFGVDDTIVFHSAWPNALFASTAESCTKALRVFFLHDPPDGHITWEDRISRKMHPELVVCNSRFTADRSAELFPGTRRRVIHCPVTPPTEVRGAIAREGFRRALGTAKQAVVVLQVGRWEKHKGHLQLLEALSHLREVPDWECWQVGAPQRPQEAEYQAEVVAAAGNLGIADRVRFLGWQDDLDSVFAAADLYCQPNIRAEPFGIAFVEALYRSLPVVTTAIGGPAEIINSSCGMMCPPGDFPALVQALRELLTDAKKRKALAVAAPQRARELCDPGRRIPELYEFVLSARSALVAV